MDPEKQPEPTTQVTRLRFADVAVTYTAAEFQGIYRGKKHHESDFDEVLARAAQAGCVRTMLTTMTLEGARQNAQVCRRRRRLLQQQSPSSEQQQQQQTPPPPPPLTTCHMTLGVHPYHAAELYDGTSGLDEVVALGRALEGEGEGEGGGPLVVAFGEIGLDYFYLERAPRDVQRRAFVEQLEAAATTFAHLPLFLHVRDAYDDFAALVRPFVARFPRRGLVHSFAGTDEEMRGLVELGFDVGVSGASFKTEQQLQMVRAIPLERLQLETDAPWCEVSSTGPAARFLQDAPPLPPSRRHGKFVRGEMVKGRNESCTIERVARVVAGVKGVPLELVVEAAWKNSVEMFGLGPESDGR